MMVAQNGDLFVANGFLEDVVQRGRRIGGADRHSHVSIGISRMKCERRSGGGFAYTALSHSKRKWGARRWPI